MLHLVTNAMPPDALQAGDFLVTGLSAMLSLNIVLFMFNLLPLPPLDGGRRCSRCCCPRTPHVAGGSRWPNPVWPSWV
jgi:Zn-dependent protease